MLAPVGPHQRSCAGQQLAPASLIRLSCASVVWWSMTMYSASGGVPLGELAAAKSTRMAWRTLPRWHIVGRYERKWFL